MKITWLMSAYNNPDLIVEILKTVYKEGDSIFLHYDKKSSDVFQQIIKSF